MKPASVNDIKKALLIATPNELAEIVLRLAKYRKENKELITFLLFEHENPALYLKQIKQEIDFQFSQMGRNVYLAKKTLRKALQTTNKYIKIFGTKQMEVELLMYFCHNMKQSSLAFHHYPVTENIYLRQIAKIDKALSGLHEDLQYDYQEGLKEIKNYK